MKCIKQTLALVMMILLTGCFATTAKYEEMLSSWVGSTEQQLVGSWGVPDGLYKTGGAVYLTYYEANSGYTPARAPTSSVTNVVGGTAITQYYGGSSGSSYSRSCKTTFTIVSGIIQAWAHKGNNCKSK